MKKSDILPIGYFLGARFLPCMSHMENTMATRTVTPIINNHCQLGENPLWNTKDQCLYWTDIDAGKIYRCRLEAGETGKREQLYHGPTVGGFTFQADGDLLLFRINDLAVLHPDGSVDVLLEYQDEGMERFNDVIADPEGRVYAGSIGKTDDSGGLYRVDLDGSITCLWRGTGCSNGMGFAPDLKTFYWTCSSSRRIFQYTYQRETGELGAPELFYQTTEQEGIPDGLTVDSEGHVWSARWDGHAVVRHDPTGKVLETIPLPVAKVTSLCLGGPDLDQFYITSAGGTADSDTLDGAIFQMPAPHLGRPEFESLIRL
jgi:sugar lactone lactonase YvrE